MRIIPDQVVIATAVLLFAFLIATCFVTLAPNWTYVRMPALQSSIPTVVREALNRTSQSPEPVLVRAVLPAETTTTTLLPLGQTIMYHRISTHVIATLLNASSTTAMPIYLALLSCSDRNGAITHVSVRRLVELTGLAERSVYTALAELEASGLVLRNPRQPGPVSNNFVLSDSQAGDDEQTNEAEADCRPERRRAAMAESEDTDLARVVAAGCTATCTGAQDAVAGAFSDSWPATRAGNIETPDRVSGTAPVGILRTAAGCLAQHDAPGDGDPAKEDILRRVAGCYRALCASEVIEVFAFVGDFFDGDVNRFRAAINAIQPGVAAETTLAFFLAVIQTADRVRKR